MKSLAVVAAVAGTPEVSNSGFTLMRPPGQTPLLSPSTCYLSTPNDESEVRFKPTWVEKQRSWLCSTMSRVAEVFQSNTGILLVAGSQAFFSMMNVAVKKLSDLDPPVPPLELVVARMVITYVCCITYMLIMKVPDPFLGPEGVRLLLVFRGFSGFFGLFGLYYSLQFLSLSDATVLTFLSPFTTAIASALILKETFSRREALAGLSSLLGVVLIARPTALFGNTPIDDTGSFPAEKGTPGQRLGAVGVALLGVLGSTGAYISLSAIGKRAHQMHSMSSLSLQSVLVASVGIHITKVPIVLPTNIESLHLFIMIGIFGFLAQLLLTSGLQREAAGRGTMAIYIQIVFAMILERIFFHSSPSFLSIVGTVIIVSSAIYIALTKERSEKQTVVRLDHPGEASMEEGLLHEDEDASHTSSNHVKVPSPGNDNGVLDGPSKPS